MARGRAPSAWSWRASSGRATVAGVDLEEVDPADWRWYVAWVPQRPRLLRATLADIVRLGRPGADDEAVRATLAAAGAGHLADALPDGLRTFVEGGHGLSAGERRRVATARALLRDAPLVVLDEPTADLDPETAAEVARAVLRLTAGRTAILVTHAACLARAVDRVAEIVEGRLAAARAWSGGRR